MKNLIFVFIFLSTLLFQSCKDKITAQTGKTSGIQKIEEITKEKTLKGKKEVTSVMIREINSIVVQKIDSLQFYAMQVKSNSKPNIPERITDLKTARKMLADIVKFTSYKDSDEMNLIQQINFRNGKILKETGEFSESNFVAYFPKEDILLLEGGHTTDVSYNLRNGEETENTGNPNLMSFSPQQNYRLNGHYGGQQCFSYFIQKKVGGEYKKIIQLDEAFEKITKIWLCIVGKSFWSDEKTLYLTEASDFSQHGIRNKYFKITLQDE